MVYPSDAILQGNIPGRFHNLRLRYTRSKSCALPLHLVDVEMECTDSRNYRVERARTRQLPTACTTSPRMPLINTAVVVDPT